MSSIFSDMCFIDLAIETSKTISLNKIICNTNAQKKVLEQYFGKAMKSMIVISRENRINIFYQFFRPYYNLFYNIFLSFRLIKNKNRNKIEIPIQKKIIIIDMFFIESMFKDGIYKERYYPDLLNNLSSETRSHIYFVPTILLRGSKNFREALNIANKSEQQFLYKFNYLKFIDYVKAIYFSFSPLRKKVKRINFDRYNIAPLIRRDLNINKANISIFRALLNFYFFKRLKENGVNVLKAINWFENQIIDKGFNLGLSKFYPKASSLGIVGYIPSFTFKDSHLQPTEVEKKYKLIPHTIGVIGRGLIPEFKKYCKSLNVITFPALRNAGINLRGSSSAKYKGNDYFKVLVTLPIRIEDSFEIIDFIEQIYKEKKLKIKWEIKPHPSLNPKKINDKIKLISKDITLVSGSFYDHVQNCNLLIGNASSTLLEALSFGVPTIIIGRRNGITDNPISNNISKDYWDICYSSNEFVKTFNRLVINKDKDFIKSQKILSEKIKSEYFEPIDRNVINKLINL